MMKDWKAVRNSTCNDWASSHTLSILLFAEAFQYVRVRYVGSLEIIVGGLNDSIFERQLVKERPQSRTSVQAKPNDLEASRYLNMGL